MEYRFDEIIDRRGTDSLKWDVAPNELPMWVADMDFRTAPEILDALRERLDQGVFGYTDVSDRWYEAYIRWWSDRHHVVFRKDWLLFCTGVVPAISSIVRKLTTPNENVVIQTPVYNIFFNSILNNGCRVLESPLKYENGQYQMDFKDLETKLSDPQTSLMILCNPQNPAGMIWSRSDLEKVGKLAHKYHVTVVSDEIHCDLTAPGKDYVPFSSVSDLCKEISITCLAPTKTFNLAGLQTAAVCVPDAALRHKVWRALNTDEVAEPNVFALTGAIAAFEKGGPWLDELRDYLFRNRRMLEDYLAEEVPGVFAVHGDATYLCWVDVSSLGADSSEIASFIRKHTGLFVSAGSAYGECGKHFLRINVACPEATLKDGLNRLKKGIELFKKQK